MYFRLWFIRLTKHRLLDNVLLIPISTYIQAMHIAGKYSMDDVQFAIVHVIKTLSSGQGIGKAIARLAFTAEFPSHFTFAFARHLFTEAYSLDYHPTANDLAPLIIHPAFVALMMQYREGLGNPDNAIWGMPEMPIQSVPWIVQPQRPERQWLDKELQSLGFKRTL